MNDDIRVAEILGWRAQLRNDGLGVVHAPGSPLFKNRHWQWTEVAMSDVSAQDINSQLPRFTADPAADYLVLEWVREREDNDAKYALYGAFSMSLLQAWAPRSYWPDAQMIDAMYYQPGDYSRALLELDKKGLLGRK